MTRDRDIERVLEHWLTDGANEMPDRVYQAIFDRVERQPQAVRPRLLRRLPRMNTPMRILATAAAVVLIAVIGYNLLPASTSQVGGPGPAATPSPSPTPVAARPPRRAPRSPGLRRPSDPRRPDGLHHHRPGGLDGLRRLLHRGSAPLGCSERDRDLLQPRPAGGHRPVRRIRRTRRPPRRARRPSTTWSLRSPHAMTSRYPA